MYTNIAYLGGVHEDIVAHGVVPAIVLVVSGVRHVVDEVVLPDDALAAFVVVKPPAAIVGGADVIDDIVGDARPEARSQRVDAAHVGHDVLSDRIDAVKCHGIALGQRP